jgi:hypothetical protein
VVIGLFDLISGGANRSNLRPDVGLRRQQRPVPQALAALTIMRSW